MVNTISSMAKLQYMSNYLPYVEEISKPPASIFPKSNSISSFLDMFSSTTSTAQEYNTVSAAYDAKKSADDLSAAMNTLTSKGNNSVFRSFSAVSSDEGALTVSVLSPYVDTGKSYSIGVSQLAESQKNTGYAFVSDGFDLAAGNYQIGLEVDGKESVVSFTITEEDDNEAAQNKIADAINRSGAGVNASVNTSDGTSSLVFEHTMTGSEHTFGISDVYSQSGVQIASYLGLDNVSRNSVDALYTVNGTQRSSSANSADIAPGIMANFSRVTDEPVEISFERDVDSVVSAVEDMASSFNELITMGNGTLQTKLSGLSNTYRRSLSDMGVQVASDGKLSVNSDVLAKAADSSSLSAFFGNAHYGFASELSRVSQSVSQSPITYTHGNSATNNLMTYLFNAYI